MRIDLPDRIIGPGEPGCFGFGISESHAECSGLGVYRPAAEPRSPKCAPGTSLAGPAG